MPPLEYEAVMTFRFSDSYGESNETYALKSSDYWTSLGQTPTLGSLSFTTPKTIVEDWDYLYIGIGIVILISAIILSRKGKRKKNIQTTAPVCSDCGSQATWIQQYNRWYCYNCEKYLE